MSTASALATEAADRLMERLGIESPVGAVDRFRRENLANALDAVDRAAWKRAQRAAADIVGDQGMATKMISDGIRAIPYKEPNRDED